MVYTIERRKLSGGGALETVWEVRSYERIADNGAFRGGRTLRTVKTKKEAERSLLRRGLRCIGPVPGIGDIYVSNMAPENHQG